MTQSLNPNQIVSQILRLIKVESNSEIRLNANGGNSILIVCNPVEEIKFINSICKNIDVELFKIIDLNELLKEFVKTNKEQLKELFDLLQGSVNQIFKVPQYEEGEDFFKQIIRAISEAYSENKIPFVIGAGVLYGADIDSIQIIEHKSVMNATKPLIFLYPATSDGDSLLFLSKRPASKYRCMIIS
jgi:hypothetical protein